MKRHRLGTWGETLALQHLQAIGYSILERNWRSAEGEIDLVAQDGDVVVFVEVKTRTSRAFGSPEESITRRKRTRLQRAAEAYLEANGLLDALWRIDIVAIDCTALGKVERLEHYVDAIDRDPDLM
jgi:putative endonuclease